MKLYILSMLILMVGCLSSCADEQPTQPTPTAEKASLKTNLKEIDGSKTSTATITSDTKVETSTNPTTVRNNSVSNKRRGSQNFDPNSDTTYYNTDKAKNRKPIQNNNTDDIQVEIEPSTNGIPEMTFKESRYYFGTVEEGDKVTHSFQFVNTGTGDLVIANATASCGCTKPNFSFLPVKPNTSSTIEVTFNSAGRDGMQSKSITITSNAYPKVRKVYLEGKVVPKGTMKKDEIQADTEKQ